MATTFPESFIEALEKAGDQAFTLLEQFVTDHRAEDLYLDFKEKKHRETGQLAEDDRRALAKAISGFAHSEGGLIVWGIEARKADRDDPESPDVAQSIKPISNLTTFHSNLNDAIAKATSPAVPGVRNLKITKAANKGYVVTFVPAGDTPPYRADICNNHFYKRSGSRFYPMESFDLRDLISRGRYPKIRLDFSYKLRHNRAEAHLYELYALVVNLGPYLLDKWEFIIECPELIDAKNSVGISSPFDEVQRFVGPDGLGWERSIVRTHPALAGVY